MTRPKRHSGLTRLCHWINLICFLILLPSGLQIFNAYPRLHFAPYGSWEDPAAAEIVSAADPDRGSVHVGPLAFDTTGVLGVSTADGRTRYAAFPAWATLPGHQNLALGRRWHFFFAWIFVVNGAVYLAAGLLSGHFRRDVVPSGTEMRPRNLARDVMAHLRLRLTGGHGYNSLQKITYLAVIFGLLPLMVLTGMTMSPGLNAVFPFLLDIFGGRPTARSIHFICAALLVLFVLVHVLMVLLSGPIRQLRAMITGGTR